MKKPAWTHTGGTTSSCQRHVCAFVVAILCLLHTSMLGSQETVSSLRTSILFFSSLIFPLSRCSAACSAACRPGLSKSCASYWVEEGENTKYCSRPDMCQDCSFKTRLYFYTFSLKSSLLSSTNELSEAQGTQLICLRSCIKSVMISGSVSPEDTHSPLEPRAGTEKEQSLARAAVLRWVSRAGA